MRIDIHTHPVFEVDGVRYTSERGFLKEMDKAGIDRAVLLPIDLDVKQFDRKMRTKRFSRLFREAYEYERENTDVKHSFDDYVEESRGWFRIVWPNQRVHEMCSRNPDRFIGFGSVNPNRGRKTIEEKIDQFVEWGFRGIKLIPTFQFFNPSDKKLDVLYQKAMDNNLVVLIHTGCDPGAWDYPPMSEDANPKYLHPVAEKYKGLKIIASHIGAYSGYEQGIWFDEAIELMQAHDNVYTDIAALRRGTLFGRKRLLEKTIERVGADRILFGSDHPVVERYPMRTTARMIDKSGLSKKDKKLIMGENARRVLGL